MIKITRIVSLFLLASNLYSLNMDHPQKTNAEREIIQIDDAMIQIDNYKSPVLFMPKKIFDSQHVSFNEGQIRFNEPYVMTNLIFTESRPKPKTKVMLMPARNLFNCNDKSKISFTMELPLLPNAQFNIVATCKKNPLISTFDFHTQFNTAMQSFYENPAFINQGQFPQDLINARVLISEDTLVNRINITPFSGLDIARKTYKHGANGFPNKERFVQFIATKKTNAHGKSMHNFVMNRQCGNNGLKRYPKAELDLDLILNLCIKEMEQNDPDFILEECFTSYTGYLILKALMLNRFIQKN